MTTGYPEEVIGTDVNNRLLDWNRILSATIPASTHQYVLAKHLNSVTNPPCRWVMKDDAVENEINSKT